MTFEQNMKWLDDHFDGDDNRSAAALNTLLSAFGGKYTDLNGVEVRVADHSANMARVYGNNGDNFVNVTVLGDGIYVTGKGRKSFAFEQADDVYEYVESLCPEEIEEEL